MVAGSDEGSTGEDFAVTRHNGDGSLDSSFSGNGRLTTDFAGGPDAASAVAVQADGKIFAAGSSDQGATGVDVALARYEVSGAPDTAPQHDDHGRAQRHDDRFDTHVCVHLERG